MSGKQFTIYLVFILTRGILSQNGINSTSKTVPILQVSSKPTAKDCKITGFILDPQSNCKNYFTCTKNPITGRMEISEESTPCPYGLFDEDIQDCITDNCPSKCYNLNVIRNFCQTVARILQFIHISMKRIAESIQIAKQEKKLLWNVLPTNMHRFLGQAYCV
uniref:Chitin-binding type-2 domain-containing protein n=1 Tax=Megaselia scalaris TaxID=36166 RepID=T1GBY4_MEGSC